MNAKTVLASGWAASDGGGEAASTCAAPESNEWSALEPGARRWVLRRHCALAPSQLFGACLGAWAVQAAAATALAAAGYAWVAVFVGLEGLAWAVALLVYARHARDGEAITLTCDDVRIECRCGSRTTRQCMPRAWTRVHAPEGNSGLLQLRWGTRHVALGRHVPHPERHRVARELAVALRTEHVDG